MTSINRNGGGSFFARLASRGRRPAVSETPAIIRNAVVASGVPQSMARRRRERSPARTNRGGVSVGEPVSTGVSAGLTTDERIHASAHRRRIAVATPARLDDAPREPGAPRLGARPDLARAERRARRERLGRQADLARNAHPRPRAHGDEPGGARARGARGPAGPLARETRRAGGDRGRAEPRARTRTRVAPDRDRPAG